MGALGGSTLFRNLFVRESLRSVLVVGLGTDLEAVLGFFLALLFLLACCVGFVCLVVVVSIAVTLPPVSSWQVKHQLESCTPRLSSWIPHMACIGPLHPGQWCCVVDNVGPTHRSPQAHRPIFCCLVLWILEEMGSLEFDVQTCRMINSQTFGVFCT